MTDRAPLAAQYVAYLLPRLDPADLHEPSSRRARAAVQAAAAGAGLTISPTRRELAHGIRYLHQSGILPTREQSGANNV